MRVIADEDIHQIGGGKPTPLETLYLEMVNRTVPFNGDKFPHLLYLLYKDLDDKIDKLDDNEIHSSTNKVQMHEDIGSFFEQIDRTDTNYIGVANIFALQCVLLFTKACKPPTIEGLDSTSESIDSTQETPGRFFNNAFTFFLGDEGSSYNWKNYQDIKQRILVSESISTGFQSLNRYNKFNKLYFIYPTQDRPDIPDIFGGIDLYVVSPFSFNTTNTIEQYLDHIFFSGLITHYDFADSIYMNPFYFMCHDFLLHSTFYERNVSDDTDFEKNLKEFYYMIKEKFSGYTDKLYMIKLVIYCIVHEILEYSFPKNKDDLEDGSVSDGGFMAMKNSFSTKEDLFMALPSRIRQLCNKFKETEEFDRDFNSITKQSVVDEEQINVVIVPYLTECYDEYYNEVSEWWRNKHLPRGGRKQRKQKTRKTKRNNTRRKRRKTRR